MKKFPIELDNVKPNSTAKLVVICESPLVSDPQKNMDKAVKAEKSNYVYEEEFLDNPWIRLVVHGIENLQYQHNTKNGIALSTCEIEYKNRKTMLHVLFANPQIANPKPILEEEVLRLTSGSSYNAFTDCSRRNPWVRLVVLDLNRLLGGEW